MGICSTVRNPSKLECKSGIAIIVPVTTNRVRNPSKLECKCK